MSPVVPENILRHEIIGLDAKIVSARTRSVRGARGVVVDESKNMITLLHQGRKTLIPKSIVTIRFRLPDGCLVDVDGTRLIGRPENRLKAKVRRW